MLPKNAPALAGAFFFGVHEGSETGGVPLGADLYVCTSASGSKRAIRGPWADSRRPNERGPPTECASLIGFVPQEAVVNGGNQTM